jgi:ABC-type Na+ efflux pump permease subunit
MNDATPTAVPAPPAVRRHRAFSLQRVLTIAGGTLTQMVRMKVFLFMLIFAAAIIASGFIFANLRTEQELKTMKDIGFAGMSFFCMVFAIAGTALLLPRDIEDRTLYTILCKPVPRLEYLIGKAAGVILLIGISLLFMDVLFSTVLYFKEKAVAADLVDSLGFRRIPLTADERAIAEQEILQRTGAQGLTWNLQAGVLAIFLKSIVLTIVSLLMSTLASSTLFTIMSSLAVMVIGHAQSMAREFLLGEQGVGPAAKLVAGAIALIFPDFKSFDIVDAVVTGTAVPLTALGQMTGLTAVYAVLYMMAAWIIFAGKEL